MRPASAPLARLDDVRRRLELVLAATYGPLRIEAAEAPRVPGVLRRLAARMPAHLRPRGALPSAAGERVLLPASLALPPADAVARFRVLALEQGERLARGTALHAPPRGQPLERDLYLLAEGA
ncbi:MAG: hypothetical protein ACJ8AO_22740, partial [Gemmatimonadaceae bacterium]